MSRVMGFRDLRIIPELAQYNEVELLHPSMDAVMNKYLEQLGFNTNAPIEYIPNNYRDMQGKTGVGFRAVGTINADSAYLRSPLASMEDRITATYYKDPTLAKELAMMMNTGISFVDVEVTQDGDEDDFPEELVEPTYEDVAAELKRLEDLRDAIRGPVYNESGAPKTPAEYKEFYDAAQR